MELPVTPQGLVDYMMMNEEGRWKFNKENPNFWYPYDSAQGNPRGFFSVLREALSYNERWVEIFKDEMESQIEHRDRLMDKIKQFYQHLYVGPMIGSLPFFTQWRLPVEAGQDKQERAWPAKETVVQERQDTDYDPNAWTE